MAGKRENMESREQANGEENLDRVLAGFMDTLPEQESHVVRVFFSSTFTDMQTERNWLMKHAVPDLRQFCSERGLNFQIVDMRWGVREDATDDHQTTKLCLQEIRNCQRLSRGPNFVAFLGDKYGYRPLPDRIEGKEFRILKSTAMKLGHDITCLDTWYKRDENAETAEFVLQPISSVFKSFNDVDPLNELFHKQAQDSWWQVNEKMKTILRSAADLAQEEGKISKETRHKYYQSVTENEVYTGIFRAPDIKDKVAVFSRSLLDITLGAQLAGRYTDLLEGDHVDMEAEEMRERLRVVKLPTVLHPGQMRRYGIRFNSAGVTEKDKGHLSYLHLLTADFVQSLKMMILVDLMKHVDEIPSSQLYTEVLHHLHFCRAKCEVLCGRQSVLEEVRDKMSFFYGREEDGKHRNAKSKKISETSNSGGEKMGEGPEDGEVQVRTGVVDKAGELEEGKDVKEETDEDTGPRMKAEDPRDEEENMIKLNLKALGIAFHVGDQGNDRESDPNYDVKKEWTTLPEIREFTRPVIIHGEPGCGKTAVMAKVFLMSKTWFPNTVSIVRFMGTSPQSSTVQEVLASICAQICHLYKVDKPKELEFLSDFQQLIKHFAALLWKIDVKNRPLVIVLDSVSQSNLHWLPTKMPPNVHLLLSLVTDHHDNLTDARHVLPQGQQYISVPRLSKQMRPEFIRTMCRLSHKQLTVKQKNLLIGKFERCCLPLYWKLLMNEALSWKSYTDVTDVKLGETISAAINKLFDRLEVKHGEMLIKRSLGYLCAARDGLTDGEMEDILSLDNDVLEDSYIYHLPPDPNSIRLPPLLWKRVQHDIQEYVVEKQSGGKSVISWYHKLFADVAKERYMCKKSSHLLHQMLGEYFIGIWSDRMKPIKLTKGKKGSYPNASRQVPAQPVTYGPNVFNVRKLTELPYHLILSGNFQSFLLTLASSCDWLYAKCRCLGLTALLTDFRLAADEMDLMKSQDSLIQCSIDTIASVLTLGSASIRKDPVNLPVQVLCQLGRYYQGNVYLENLTRSALDWCTVSSKPLLLPQSACMQTPGGILLYTIEVDVNVTGEKRDYSRCMHLREDTEKLFVIQQRSLHQDELLVFDLRDKGSCIISEDLNRYIRTIHFLGNNRYLFLQVYKVKDQYHPIYYDQLFESSTATPLPFPDQTKVIAVSYSGKYIAYGLASIVYLCTRDEVDRSLKVVHTLSNTKVDTDVRYLLFSQDEKQLIAFYQAEGTHSFLGPPKKGSCRLVWSVKKGKVTATLDDNLEVNMHSVVTKNNRLICSNTEESYKRPRSFCIVDILEGKTLHTVDVSEHYEIRFIRLHPTEKYVVIGFRDTAVINGIRDKHARLYSVETGEQVSVCSEVNGPYSDLQMFGKDEVNIALCVYDSYIICILSAGSVEEPLTEAVLIRRLAGHNLPIIQLIVHSDESQLFSASQDNTIKVWDLKKVMYEYHDCIPQVKASKHQSHKKTVLLHEQVTRAAEVFSHLDIKIPSTQLVMDRGGRTAYVSLENGQLHEYDLDRDLLVKSTQATDGIITHLHLSRNGHYLAIAAEGSISVIKVEDFEEHLKLDYQSKVSAMTESNNTLVVASSGMDARAKVWNIETGELLKELQMLYSFQYIAINTKATAVVSTFFEFPVILPLDDDTSGGLNMEQADVMMTGSTAVTISPNDKYAASAAVDGSIRVILMTGQYIYRMQTRSSAVSLVFTRDSRNLLSAGYRTIYVWSMKDGSLRYKLTRHLDFIHSMKFDLTGRFLVTTSRDKQLILWDFQRAVSVATFQTNCQAKIFDIAPRAETIAYIPESIANISVLKPNDVLEKILQGKYVPNRTTAEARAMALTFSSNKAVSGACSVM